MGGITTIINKVKYIGIASLTIAILSVLILNLISTYSSSNIESNAEPVGNVSTLASDSTCDPNNTNAPSCISMSISSHSATGDTNDGNLSLSIPQGGDLVAGRHTVTVNSNNVTGYNLYLTSKTDDTDMVNMDNEDAYIKSMHSSKHTSYGYYGGDYLSIHSNEYGVAMGRDCSKGRLYRGDQYYEGLINAPSKPSSDSEIYAFSGLSEKSNMMDSQINGHNPGFGKPTCTVYYGVWLDNPSTMLAGNYTVDVEYTAIASEVQAPTIKAVTPDTYELGSDTGLDTNSRLPVTITGTNLKSTYKVYLESNADSSKRYDITTENITSITDTQLKITLPTDKTDADLEPGEYTIHVVTQGGEETIGFSYTEKTIQSSYSVYDPDDNVRVDWDGGMIPVVYDSASQTWKSLASSDITSSDLGWFDYSGRQWANAVTVKDPSKYQNKEITVSESDILAFWVYIPRYAYKVMRKDSTDRYVNAQNFEIQFETTDYGAKHIPKTSCNANATSASAMWRDGNRNNDVLSNIKVGYYQNCAGMNNSYSFGSTGSVISTTSWATHPAFTFGDQELNGLWVGKFELTGSTSQPTILPNQKHLAQDIVTLYDVAKSMGQEDKDNTGGGNTNVRKNNQNLSIASTRMVNNSDWGAITYLAASKYGAGYDGVQQNTQEQSGLDGDNNSSTGVTGCGPASQNSVDTYSNGGKLGTNLACSSSDSRYAYNGSIGVTASTTGNVYGVYDMSGGAWEYTVANTTTSDEHTTSVSDAQFTMESSEPYANLYRTSEGFDGARPAWWNTRTNYSKYGWSREICRWGSCGGQAIHEVANFQTNNNTLFGAWVGNGYYDGTDQYVNGNDAVFPSLTEGQPWFIRGECVGWSKNYNGGEMFAFNMDSGMSLDTYGTRAVLMLN